MRWSSLRPARRDANDKACKLRPLVSCIKIGWLVGVLLVLTVNSALADELIMKNGDRLQGEVLSMSLGKLVFKTSYAGEISIDWDQVALLTTDGPLEVYLRDERTLEGKAVAAEEGKLVLQPETGPPTPPIAMAQVKTLDLPEPEKWEFNARVAAGASKYSGNTKTETYNLDGDASLFKFPHSFELHAEYYREKDKGEVTKDLNLLFQISAGPGYQVWRSRKKNLSISIGPAYALEKYTRPMKNFDNKDHREYFAGYWAVDFDMWFFNRFFRCSTTTTVLWIPGIPITGGFAPGAGSAFPWYFGFSHPWNTTTILTTARQTIRRNTTRSICSN